MNQPVQTFIRRMSFDDIEQVVAIDLLSFALPWPERSFRYEVIENPVARCWVAETYGRVVGMLVLWLLMDEAHIATLATHPDFRRQGIAERILEEALQAAQIEGVRRAFLEVRSSNVAARKMYKKHGFKFTGRRPHYYKDNNEDAIFMALDGLNI